MPKDVKDVPDFVLAAVDVVDGCTKRGNCFRAFWHLHKTEYQVVLKLSKRTGDWRELGRGYCNTNANDDHFCKTYFVEKLGHKWTCDRRS